MQEKKQFESFIRENTMIADSAIIECLHDFTQDTGAALIREIILDLSCRGLIRSRMPKNEFRQAFDAQVVKAHNTARAHGWHDEPRSDGEVLALIHCEVSEALQALREGNPPDKHCKDFSSLEIELADVIIRIMDYAGEQNLDIAGAILAKMDYNQTRPYKHGRKF